MSAPILFEYAVVRVVPYVDREEFINVGVIVSCHTKHFLSARIELDRARLSALAPGLDADMVRRHLDVIPIICAGGKAAGPVGLMNARARFHWLVAPSSTIIQTSAVHSGLCADPEAVLEHLLEEMVRKPGAHGTGTS